MSASEPLKKDQLGVSPPPPQEPNNVPRKRRWVWPVIIVVLIAGSIFVYRTRGRSAAAAKGPSAPPAFSVSVTPVQTRDMPFYLTGLGSVAAFNTVTVKTRVDGQIVRVNFKEGQFVKEGDLLIEIDPRPYQVALDQANGQYAKDLASQNDAKIDLNRYQTAMARGSGSPPATGFAAGHGRPV